MNVTNPQVRELKHPQDIDAIKRIWREVGWAIEEHAIDQVSDFFRVGHTLVGTLADVAECAVHITQGSLRMGKVDLPLSAVSAVTTSRIARGHSFAQRLTALQLRKGRQLGACVSALGMFDQGFYDKLGFATGSYEHRFSFDPATLDINHSAPTPVRLAKADYAQMYEALKTRHKVNGSVVLLDELVIKCELGFDENGFGLGFKSNDKLTHFIWLNADGEHGPYDVRWMAYQSTEHLMDLLALLKSLGDQVYSIHMMEPPEIQFQSLLRRPFRNLDLTEKSKYEAGHEAFAWWQFRILDVVSCVAAMAATHVDIEFVVQLSDPVESVLERFGDIVEDGWNGVGGHYLVKLGASNSAEFFSDSQVSELLGRGLPLLRCSVGAFTRYIWGVAKASSLAITDDFEAPASLLMALNDSVHLPAPRLGWDF